METTRVPPGRLVSGEDMVEAEVRSLCGGSAALFSARGPHKESGNEDAAALIEIHEQRAVLIVADGVGGQPGGASASRLVIGSLEQHLLAASEDGRPVRAAILDAVEEANQAVLDLGIGAATTLAAVDIHEQTLRPYHIGDSEIVVVGQRGRIKLQTVAHSPVGYAVEAGMLDVKEAMHHDDRHLVSNLIGEASMRIEVGSRFPLSPMDTVVLATDGLFDNLHVEEVVECVRTKPLRVVAEQLARRARRRMLSEREGQPSKPDDLTFLLYRPREAKTG